MSSSKTPTNPLDLEKKLRVRLKWMGVLLLIFAACALLWDVSAMKSEEDELEELLTSFEETLPPLNHYLVSSCFTLVGGCCLIICWKKKLAWK